MKWNKAKAEYNDTPARRVRTSAEHVARRIAAEMRREAEHLVAERITAAEFAVRMRGHVKRAHLAQSLLATGGKANQSAGTKGALGNLLKKQYAFLAGFVTEIDNGTLSDAQIIARAQLYGAATLQTFESQRRRVKKDAGFTQERNVLDDAEHCRKSPKAPGCLEETARGWVEIGTLSLPGSRTCLVNCKCLLEYKK